MQRDIPASIPRAALDAALDSVGIDRRSLVKAEIGSEVTLTYYRTHDDGRLVLLPGDRVATEVVQVAIEGSTP